MRHNIQAEGFGVRLRPVTIADAAFIVWLRGLDHVRGKVGDSATDVAAQEAWIERYFDRKGDYYFIVESLGGIPLGTHGIYDVEGTSGESGRYIMRPEVIAGPPSSVLAMDLAFGELGLTELRASSVSTNLKVHSLHRKFGYREVGLKRGAQMIDGKPIDLVQFVLGAADWAKARVRQEPLALAAEKQVLEWEQSQLEVKTSPWHKLFVWWYGIESLLAESGGIEGLMSKWSEICQCVPCT